MNGPIGNGRKYDLSGIGLKDARKERKEKAEERQSSQLYSSFNISKRDWGRGLTSTQFLCLITHNKLLLPNKITKCYPREALIVTYKVKRPRILMGR